jgi:hypothetical protein
MDKKHAFVLSGSGMKLGFQVAVAWGGEMKKVKVKKKTMKLKVTITNSGTEPFSLSRLRSYLPGYVLKPGAKVILSGEK